MSANLYSPAALAALINSQRYPLPLSHSHALEIVAVLRGSRDWNSVAGSQAAPLLKAAAKALRAALKTVEPSKAGISLAQAQALADAMSEEQPRSSESARSMPSKSAAQPIKIQRGMEPNEWVVFNPNPLATTRVDALLESYRHGRPRNPAFILEMIREGERIVEEFPGDIEAHHTLATLYRENGRATDARRAWKSAHALASDAISNMLAEDPDANLSYGDLRNRPLLRAIHGLTCASLGDRNANSLLLAESLSLMLHGLMRDRDAFGAVALHGSALAWQGKWEELAKWITEQGGDTFEDLALHCLALANMDSPDLEEAQLKIIRLHPFAAEAFLHPTQFAGYAPDTVSGGTWEEGACHMSALGPLWAKAPDVWGRLKRRIHDAQVRWLKSIDSRSVHEKTVRYLYHSANFRLEHVMPEADGLRPLLSNTNVNGASSIAHIDTEQMESVTREQLNSWMVDHRSLNTRGTFLEWLLHRAIRASAKGVLIVPQRGACIIEFDGAEFVTLKPDYSEASVDMHWVLSGATKIKDNTPVSFLLKSRADLDAADFSVSMTWKYRRGIEIVLSKL